MPNPSKNKGNRFEREVVNLAKGTGLKAYRIPLSGATWLKGDVMIEGYKFECKARHSGFKQIEKWIEGFDGVMIKRDNGKIYAILPLETLFHVWGFK